MTATEYSSKTMGYEQKDLLALIPYMRAFARSLCRDSTQADDLTQESLIRALKAQASYESGTNLKAWLFAIVRNQFYSDKRRSWRAPSLDQRMAEETLVAVSRPDAGLELGEVHAAMLELCDEQREALILIGVAGMSYEEVAVICRCAVGTIKSRVCRARQRLVSILAGEVSIGRSSVPGGALAAFFADANRLCARVAA